MLEIELRLLTDDGLALGRHICTCQTTLLACHIIKIEDFTKLLVIRRITEAHHRVAVHQDTITLV